MHRKREKRRDLEVQGVLSGNGSHGGSSNQLNPSASAHQPRIRVQKDLDYTTFYIYIYTYNGSLADEYEAAAS